MFIFLLAINHLISSSSTLKLSLFGFLMLLIINPNMFWERFDRFQSQNLAIYITRFFLKDCMLSPNREMKGIVRVGQIVEGV
jgi:hypothetical protein